jgi:hypothetical protein
VCNLTKIGRQLVINYFKKFQLYRQNGPNPRCVTPSSDHFGGILSNPIDLDLLGDKLAFWI